MRSLAGSARLDMLTRYWKLLLRSPDLPSDLLYLLGMPAAFGMRLHLSMVQQLVASALPRVLLLSRATVVPSSNAWLPPQIFHQPTSTNPLATVLFLHCWHHIFPPHLPLAIIPISL